MRDGALLLVECTMPGEPPFWVLPGGGREVGETDQEAVAREIREELGVDVEIGPILDDVPADPPDGTYTRWRTYACRITSGEPTRCGADGSAEISALKWLPSGDVESWEYALKEDRFLFPQLERIRVALAQVEW